MDYPIWDVAFGGGVLIGIVAIAHVVVSHFAVGGGLAIALIETLAVKRRDRALRELARRSSWMLILVSTVFGAISGVGIWVTIGLVQPAATSTLIHTFVWGWAIEWAFFVLEVVTALLYWATWDRVRPRTHLLVIWLYSFAAFMSLVVIQGILSFMMTPGSWLTTRSFRDGLLNPTYVPGTLFRTGLCLVLAGAWLAFAALREADASARARLIRLLAAIEAAGALLAYAGYRWWEAVLPGEVRALFLASGGTKPLIASLAATRPLVLWALAASLAAALFSLAVPRGRIPAVALLALLAGFTSLGAYERLREGARKPFVIRDYMFSSGVLVSEIPRLNARGILSKARWATVDAGNDPVSQGRAVCRAECASCHTIDGYLSLRRITEGLDLDTTRLLLAAMKEDGDHYRAVGPSSPGPAIVGRPGYPQMPPFVGTDAEAEALAAWIQSLQVPQVAEASRAR